MVLWNFDSRLQPLQEFEGILGWAKRAGQAKKTNSAVINATIGVLKINGTVAALPTLQTKLAEVTRRSGTHEYPGLYGVWGAPENLADLLNGAVAPENSTKIRALPRTIQSISTVGGTHAILTAFCLVPQTTILSGWPYWLNYENLAQFANKKMRRFEILKAEGQGYRLNMEALEAEAESILKEEKSLSLLFNDPSSNPAGLSLSNEDISDLIRYLKTVIQRGFNVQMIIDPAYAAYDPRGVEGSNRESLLRLLTDLPEITLFYTWSATKQYLEYNNRSGALVVFNPENNIVEDQHGLTLKEYMAGIIRGTISQPPSRTDRALLELVQEGRLEDLNAERAEYVNMLKIRADRAVEEARKRGIPIVTTVEGKHPGAFMAYTPLANATEIAEKLAQENIYVVPWENHGLRIALSGMELSEIPTLYETLSHYV